MSAVGQLEIGDRTLEELRAGVAAARSEIDELGTLAGATSGRTTVVEGRVSAVEEAVETNADAIEEVDGRVTSIEGGMRPRETIYEYDLGSHASGAMDQPETVDGNVWNCTNFGSPVTRIWEAGVGLHLKANGNGNIADPDRTAAIIAIELSQIDARLVAPAEFWIWAHATPVLPGSGEHVGIGVEHYTWTVNASTRQMLAHKLATTTRESRVDSTSVGVRATALGEQITERNVFAVRHYADESADYYVGTWVDGWPDIEDMVYIGRSLRQGPAAIGLSQRVALVFAQWNTEAPITGEATIHRLRVQI